MTCFRMNLHPLHLPWLLNFASISVLRSRRWGKATISSTAVRLGRGPIADDISSESAVTDDVTLALNYCSWRSEWIDAVVGYGALSMLSPVHAPWPMNFSGDLIGIINTANWYFLPNVDGAQEVHVVTDVFHVQKRLSFILRTNEGRHTLNLQPASPHASGSKENFCECIMPSVLSI
jgi:hypothetical protein